MGPFGFDGPQIHSQEAFWMTQIDRQRADKLIMAGSNCIGETPRATTAEVVLTELLFADCP